MHYRWKDDAWIEITSGPDNAVYWAGLVSNEKGKVYITRTTWSKHATESQALREMFGITSSDRIKLYDMTSRISDMRKLIHKLPT